MKKKEKIEEVEKNHEECSCKGKCKNKVERTLILVLFLLLGGFIGGVITGGAVLFFGQDEDKCAEVKEKDDKQETENNEKDETEEWVYVSDYEKIEMRIEDLERIEQVSRNINSVEDFTNQELLLFAIDSLGYAEVHTLEEVNAVTQTYFGIDIEPEDVNCHFSTDEAPLYLYDEDKKEFVPNEEHGAHGLGSYYSDILNRIVKIEVKDNLYTVEVKKAFGRSSDTGPATTTFYKTYKEMDEFRTPIMDFKWETYEEVENYMPEVDFNNLDSDKMLTYTYVFEKVDEEFILVSYTFE